MPNDTEHKSPGMKAANENGQAYTKSNTENRSQTKHSYRYANTIKLENMQAYHMSRATQRHIPLGTWCGQQQ